MYLSIGETAKIVGISVSTLRRWEKEEKFIPCCRTLGGHRRYSLEKIKRDLLGKISLITRKVVAYARVSSNDQKEDLKRQEQRLQQYCNEQGYSCELISDLGSGINYKKKGLNKLIKSICSREVSELVLTHKDRLLRFGSQLLFQLCKFFGTKVILLDDEKEQSFEQQLVTDVIEIMTVFTAKMYGKRAHKNKQASLRKIC